MSKKKFDISQVLLHKNRYFIYKYTKMVHVLLTKSKIGGPTNVCIFDSIRSLLKLSFHLYMSHIKEVIRRIKSNSYEKIFH